MNLAEALERRSNRGPHRDPETVIAAARSTHYDEPRAFDPSEAAGDGHPNVISLATPQPDRRRTASFAAAAVIAAAVVAGGALAISRSTTTSDAPTADVPTVPAGCGQTTGQSGTASTSLASNAVLLSSIVLLPVAVPAGYCANTVSISTASNAPQRTTVWSSCSRCATLTASVKLVRSGDDPGSTETPEREHDDFSIDGRQVRFYPPVGDEPTVQLVSRDGLEPGFSFYGWGVTKNDLSDLASSLIAGNDIPSSNKLQFVFDGQLGARWPGAETVDAALQIHYTAPGGDGQLDYNYQHAPGNVPALAAFASATPNATFTTVNGQPALVSSYQRATTILLRPDDHTLIGIESVRTGQSQPLTLDELSTITFSAANSADPRWVQLSAQTALIPATGDTVAASNG